jgi:1-acyl-sn-glycerol-3-phosphate acyltransferase
MALIRSTLFALVFYPGCLVTVPIAGISALTGPENTLWGARFWARWHRWCARWILGLRTQIDKPLPQGPCLVVIKHESMFETIETLVWFNRPAVVFKKELIEIPLWGWIAKRHGVIPIDRESGAAAVRHMISAGKAALADNRPIILFPEGTRVPHGERPALGSGMAGLYRMLGVPIVPVALDSGKYSPKGSFIKKSGVVRLKVGDAIPTGLKREEVEARVHAAINALND